MNDENKSFCYTYSATQQQEVKRIRQKYLPPQANKMEQLRQLDERTTRPGKALSLLLGTVSALVLGIGMCCTMVWKSYFIPGIFIGILGIAGVCLAYPVYAITTKRQREKLAPEILRLSAELMGSDME